MFRFLVVSVVFLLWYGGEAWGGLRYERWVFYLLFFAWGGCCWWGWGKRGVEISVCGLILVKKCFFERSVRGGASGFTRKCGEEIFSMRNKYYVHQYIVFVSHPARNMPHDTGS